MLGRVFIVCGCVFVLSGCMYKEEPLPKITNDYRLNEVVRPEVVKPTIVQPSVAGVPGDWQPLSYLEKNWTAIVVHHSGTRGGNAAIFDKWHREGNHWEGVGYDFVIGNGTDSRDGQVEVTFRWRNQQTGAHCGGTPGNWANKDGIGICLVGDFNQSVPSYAQMQSLAKLGCFLQSRFGIPKGRIYGHRTTPGAGITDCPGKNFPMAKLKSMVND